MEALYNKYRPQIFEDVVGQEHIERTLKNAIAANKISHAYMFTGPRGTGKTTTARLLSKALLCQSGPTADPDGTCEDCELIASGEHPDVYELDAASRTGVENVREEIIGKVDYAPTRGKFKVYIIDEIHMLSTAAFNALLKTLEEPPDHVIFIMCTTDPQKVPETILSRCQRFDFRRISSEELVSRLGAICEMEGISFEGDALDLIAHRAQGGMRDALTSLEQLIAFGNGEVTMEVAERLLGSLDSSDLAEIVKAIGTYDVATCFNWTSSYMETGADLVQFASDLTQHIRDMYVMSLAGADVALDVTEAGRRELQVELTWFGPERLSRMLSVLGDLLKDLKTSTNQRLSFEIALTRMVRPESDLTLAALSERIEKLEGALKNGASLNAASIAAPSASPSSSAQDSTTDAQPVQPATEVVQAASSPTAIEEPMNVAADSSASVVAPEVSEASSATTEESVVESAPIAVQAGDINAPQVWNSTLAHLKKIGPAYGVLFMNTDVSMDGGTFTIAFSKTNSFSFKASQKQDARNALEQAFQRAGYPGIKYQIVQSADVREGTSAPSPAASSAPASSAGNSFEGQLGKGPDEGAQAQAQDEASAPSAGTNFEAGAFGSNAGNVSNAPSLDAIQNASAPVENGPNSSQDAASPAAGNGDGEPTQSLPDEVPPWEEAAPAQEAATDSDPDFQDFLASAFGEGVVVEEVKE